MKKFKNILQILIVLVVIGLLIYLIIEVNNLKNANKGNESSNLITITQSEKKSSLASIQADLRNNIFSLNESIAAIYSKKTVGEMVEIDSEEKKSIETVKLLVGNAIIINNEGYLLTNKHVVANLNGVNYSAVLQGIEYPVDKIWTDELLDIAVLKIKVKESTKPATIAKLDGQAEIGDIVFALKNDTDIGELITKIGLINSKNQKLEIQNNNDIYVGLLKNSTNIEGGFSGGPLINIDGEVVGINTAIDSVEYGASYALPISQEFINQTLYSIKDNGKIVRPYLGIEYEEYNGYAKITNIIEGTSSSNTNMKIGDMIVGIDNTPVTYNNFLYYLYTYKVGSQITLNMLDDGHKKDVQIKIGSR